MNRCWLLCIVRPLEVTCGQLNSYIFILLFLLTKLESVISDHFQPAGMSDGVRKGIIANEP